MDGDLGYRPAAFVGVIEFGRWGISIKSAVAGFPFTKA
jgi:hypothetical protein